MRIQFYLLILTAGLFLVNGILGKSIHESLEEFLDTQATSFLLPTSKAVGLGVAVVDVNGSFLYSKGFGHRDLELNSLANSKSLFAIASVTKSFTSTLIVKLLNEKFPELGESVVEVPIHSLGNSINLTLSDRYRTESASFRDLLSHRSCLTSHIEGINFGAINNRTDHLYRTRYESQSCPFRSSFLYNNVMVSLAGDLISRIMDDSYDNLLRTFLDELGMKDSRLMDMERDETGSDTLMQPYYTNGEGILTKASPNVVRQGAVDAPDGALLCTMEDMSKYMYFHLNKGKSIVDNKQVVPQEVMEWLYKPAIMVTDEPDYGAYGMGFDIKFIPGEESTVSHGGYITPFSSLLTISRQLNIGIFTSTNGPGAFTPNAAHPQFHNNVLQFVAQTQGKVFTPPSHKDRNGTAKITKKVVAKGSVKKTLTPQAQCNASEIVGIFGHVHDGEMEIVLDDQSGQLKLNYGTWGAGALQRIEEEECKFQNHPTSLDGALLVYSPMDGYIIENTLTFQKSQGENYWDILLWQFYPGEPSTFRRNFRLSDLPEIPYEPGSCSGHDGDTN